jgi:predicted CoA-binding protein
MTLHTDQELRDLLENARHVAIVGYSDNPSRPSFSVANTLRTLGYTVSPINPTIQSTPEVTVYPSLADVPGQIDIVDVFRRSDAMLEVVEEAISAGAKAIWMQLDIVNEEAAARAEAAGLKVVMDRCMRVEHYRLFPKG